MNDGCAAAAPDVGKEIRPSDEVCARRGKCEDTEKSLLCVSVSLWLIDSVFSANSVSSPTRSTGT